MNDKICDHKSVGILVWKDDLLLLIERGQPPFGFAPPAGHVDNDISFELAAKRELKEEVGLKAKDLKIVLEVKKDNQCRREKGTWHDWKIYVAQVVNSEINRSPTETKKAGWYSPSEIKTLAQKTKAFTADHISQADWDRNPGLEPVWYDHFKTLGILKEL